MAEFPGLSGWLETISHNDAGILLVAMMAFTGVVWLYNARFVFPRLLNVAREMLLLAFWTTFAVMILYKSVDVIALTPRVALAVGICFLAKEIIVGIRTLMRGSMIGEGDPDEFPT